MNENDILEYTNPIASVTEKDLTPQEQPTPEPVVAPEVAPEPEVEKEEISFGDAFKYAYSESTITGQAWKLAHSESFEPDPEFKMTYGEVRDKWGQGIPEKYWDNLYEAESEAELQYLREKILEKVEADNQFQQLGFGKKLGAVAAATVLDAPQTILAAFSGVGSAAALGSFGLKAALLARVGVGMVAGAAEAAVTATTVNALDPLEDIEDVQYAQTMAISSVFGGAGGALSGRAYNKQLAKAAMNDAKGMERRALEAQGLPLTEKGKAYYKSSTVDPFFDSTLAPKGEATVFGPARISMIGQLKNQKNTAGIRELGELLGEDSIGNKSGSASKPTLALEASILHDRNLGDMMRGFDSGYRKWGQETEAAGWMGRQYHKGREQFNEEVADVIRGLREPSTEGVKEAVASTRNMFSRMLKDAQEFGLKHFDNISDKETYLPRVLRSDKIRKVINDHGSPAIVTMLKGSLKSNNPEIDDKIAENVAKAWFKRGREVQIGEQARFSAALSGEDGELLHDMLINADLDKAEADRIVAYFKEKGDGGIKQSKRRIDFDEAYVDPDTGIKFTDLTENNVERLARTYAHEVSGATALAKFGYKTPQQLEAHIQKVMQEATDSGTMTKGQIEAMNRKAMNIYNQIVGRPNEQYNELKAMGQMLMDYNYLRAGGGFAIASVPEMFATVTANGTRAVFQHVPILPKFFKGLQKGTPDTELLELIDSFGIGRDIDLINTFARGAFEDPLGVETFSSKAVGKVRQGLDVGKRTVSLMSGLPQLTKFSQVISAKSTIQKFVNNAYNNKTLTKKWAAQLGLDADWQDAVYEGLKKYSKVEKGTFSGNKVRSLDWDAWYKADPDVADRFKYAVVRATNRLIQRQLPGELPEFMSKTTSRLIFQFMNFGIAAYEKKTLNALHRRDFETAVTIGLLSSIGSMTYAAQMYALSKVQKDPSTFLQERLAPNQLIKAGVQRSGYLSILPPVIDNAAYAMGFEPVFNQYARTSGLGTTPLTSNPTVQLGVNLRDSARAAGKNITDPDYHLSEKDVRAMTNLLPLRTLPGMQHIYEQMIHTIPED